MVFGTPQYRKKFYYKNYVSPNIHPGLYPSSNIQLSANVIISKQSSKRTTPKLPKYFPVFNSLIDSNICDHIIDKQIKQDTRIYTPISITTKRPGLAVIIRRKQTHVNISQYFHAAWYSSVQSTFLKLIKITTWQRGLV